MRKKGITVGVIVFPGSNCDDDCYDVLTEVVKCQAERIWHKEERLPPVDAVVLPGGFSYGDYLRCGAIARFSPIMKAVTRFAESGGYVLGICNGFQILLEAGLLPGALLRNETLQFICRWVFLRCENTEASYTTLFSPSQVVRMPIAHAEGRYWADGPTLAALRKNRQIIFRYSSADGETSSVANPNGSVDNIAGICNERGNVLGMMPHPERASSVSLGGEDGRLIFDSLLSAIEEGRPALGGVGVQAC